MKKCIDSLLVCGEDCEIIIINDGSRDGTVDIANAYAEKYPTIVRVIDKENGGHGSGVNAGIAHATGLYFKVVDSDDWLGEQALCELMRVIRKNCENGVQPDLYVTNFIYDHVTDNTKHVSGYTDKFTPGRISEWDNMKSFRFSQMMLMHALMYKLSVLKESGLELPEHTFYVDNIFAYVPLPYVKTVFYLNVDLYHYYIGRSDQSVNVDNIVKRYEQQIKITLIMADAFTYDEIKRMPKGLSKYMIHSMRNMVLLASFFTGAKCSKERKAALKGMWEHIKNNDKKMYSALRNRAAIPFIYIMPWRLRGAVMRIGYKIVCRKVKLG